MPTMGRYCKAYPYSNFKEYSNWSVNRDNLRKAKEGQASGENEVQPDLIDSDILYLQENYVVTDGVFIDENIVFDNVTPEWKEFCTTVLGFEIPAYLTEEAVSTKE